ncbi:hypothetical protein PHLGIDRAFT_461114 [Phlebiopsis gigantea 11061_1 CR5-6]|uniref:Uncharacterized protein n=1 Tax=Phlebiopsis gigantea (strain 11061_1 CR5-6) TaxID=745531 RepID=A0A0C3S9S7_PHLG1|nr:hypothetical protein PHLGIDRAFT_461114 [Phlebiopsis gigantea 11061_1 CR5-6]
MAAETANNLRPRTPQQPQQDSGPGPVPATPPGEHQPAVQSTPPKAEATGATSAEETLPVPLVHQDQDSGSSASATPTDGRTGGQDVASAHHAAPAEGLTTNPSDKVQPENLASHTRSGARSRKALDLRKRVLLLRAREFLRAKTASKSWTPGAAQTGIPSVLRTAPCAHKSQHIAHLNALGPRQVISSPPTPKDILTAARLQAISLGIHPAPSLTRGLKTHCATPETSSSMAKNLGAFSTRRRAAQIAAPSRSGQRTSSSTSHSSQQVLPKSHRVEGRPKVADPRTLTESAPTSSPENPPQNSTSVHGPRPGSLASRGPGARAPAPSPSAASSADAADTAPPACAVGTAPSRPRHKLLRNVSGPKTSHAPTGGPQPRQSFSALPSPLNPTRAAARGSWHPRRLSDAPGSGLERTRYEDDLRYHPRKRYTQAPAEKVTQARASAPHNALRAGKSSRVAPSVSHVSASAAHLSSHASASGDASASLPSDAAAPVADLDLSPTLAEGISDNRLTSGSGEASASLPSADGASVADMDLSPTPAVDTSDDRFTFGSGAEAEFDWQLPIL